MILAVDVHYADHHAVVAGVLFDDWPDAVPQREFITRVAVHAPYEPGQFYRRELPCILQLMVENDLEPDCIIVDGFVYLDGYREPGLGKHLYDALEGKVAVIGVAKSAFHGIPAEFAIYRGESRKPLYVTAAGIDIEEAKRCIAMMHGSHRQPTLLKRADWLCRNSKS
jgi:deoxyribonuclease V